MSGLANSGRVFFAEIGADEIPVELDLTHWPQVRAVIAERELRVVLTEVVSGVYWCALDGRSIEARVVREGDLCTVTIGREVFRVRLTARRRRRGPREEGGRDHHVDIRSPMPGRVIDVLVSEGASVEAGQGLLVLEAMKMQNQISSPRRGVVGKLNVQAGVAVNAGDLLARVDSGL